MRKHDKRKKIMFEQESSLFHKIDKMCQNKIINAFEIPTEVRIILKINVLEHFSEGVQEKTTKESNEENASHGATCVNGIGCVYIKMINAYSPGIYPTKIFNRKRLRAFYTKTLILRTNSKSEPQATYGILEIPSQTGRSRSANADSIDNLHVNLGRGGEFPRVKKKFKIYLLILLVNKPEWSVPQQSIFDR